ncbi:SCO family protein [Paenibacillus hamazuiensis]|uniref:SCO family protein n=1 Tax=Paenibacillus hamazuiensis TaxID=2936508 RepID=UPI00200F9CB5|nr:SCO family protein [Paenibacillus hamazuiensis]
MKKWSLTVIAFGALLMFAACGGGKAPDQLNYKVGPFRFTDQGGGQMALEDLNGKVWVAHFIFTHCTTVCPGLTSNMSQLQKKLKEQGAKAEIVTFSVDPERDSPEALKAYLSKFQADFTNWHALTGYSFEDIRKFAGQSFKIAVEKDTSSDQVIHGTSFYLVNRAGTVVARYDGEEPPYDQIVKDVLALNK